MSAFKLAQVMVDGERHVFRSTDIYDVATKKYISEFISETNSSIDAIEASISGHSKSQIVADIAARDALTGVNLGDIAYVQDASADATVESGGATYIANVVSGAVTWIKIAEWESMDVILQWANIQGKPSSAASDIDDAVAKKHAHANATVLNGISTNATSGNLVFNNVELGDYTGVAVGASVATATDYTAKIQLLVEEYDPDQA